MLRTLRLVLDEAATWGQPGAADCELRVVHLGPGENVHQPAVAARLAAAGPTALILLDMGSRAGPPVLAAPPAQAYDTPPAPACDPSAAASGAGAGVAGQSEEGREGEEGEEGREEEGAGPGGPGQSTPRGRIVPTLIVDHHQPDGFPEGATVLSSFGCPPVANSSVLAWRLCAHLHPPAAAPTAWLAVLGALGDLGEAGLAELTALLPALGEAHLAGRKTHFKDAVALINAARRSPGCDVAAAWSALSASSAPADISKGDAPGAAALRAHRAALRDEVARCASAPPRFSSDGAVALLALDSAWQVHPLLPQRWAPRLSSQDKTGRLVAVIASNRGYLPGRVHFSARRGRPDADLVAFLRDTAASRCAHPALAATRLASLPSRLGGDYARGHPEASGGMLAAPDFALLMLVADCDEANYSKYVAVMRSVDGTPQLLRQQAFNQLTELLSDRLEAGNSSAAPEVETPQVLQAFIQPHNDLRYVTTYVGGGANNVTCHTFQRKYSRRYVAAGSPLPPGAADAFASDSSFAYGASAAAADETPDPITGQGAVDPSLKMEFRKLTSSIVKYIEKAHKLTLAGIVLEWIRDSYGKIYLLSVLRTEWASNASGNGGGSLASANLTEEPQELEEVPPPPSSLAADGPSPPPPPPSLPSDFGGAAGGDPGPPTAWGAPSANSAGVYAPPPPGVSLPPPNRTGLLPLPTSRPQSAYSQGVPAGAGGSAGTVGEMLRPAGVAGVGAGSTVSHLASFPGGGRASGMSVVVNNTWPSHQHEAQLGSPSATGRGGPTSPSSGGAGGSAFQRQLSGSASQLGAHGQSLSSSGGPIHTTHSMHHTHSAGAGHSHSGRIQSARSALGNSLMAERAASGRPVRPGTAPVAFGRNANTSPLRNSALNPAPVPGVIPSTGYMDRTNSSPGAAILAAAVAAATSGAGGAARSRPATATPSSSGGGTGHVNTGSRGAPLMMQQLARELEGARDQLLAQNQLAEASAAKVRQLEREKELMVAAFDQRVAELSNALLSAQTDLRSTRADAEEQRRRATEAEARVTELELRNHALQSTLDSERGTVMTALRECHERDVSVKERAEQLEAEVLRLTERLKEETTAVAALKRQLLQFSDIAERYATTFRDGEMEPGMQEVLDKVQKLFVGQTNPFGESYAVQKVLTHYHGDLRAVFLYYAQLENNFAAYWPPGLAFQQWMLFCKETETADARANSRVSNVTAPHKMLHPRDCEALFRTYAKIDPNAINTSAPVLSYEGFLAAVVDVSFRVKRFDNPYLSEAVREYILSYVARANKMSPTGLRRGQVRDALEGTKEGPPSQPGGLVTASVTGGSGAEKRKKKATIVVSPVTPGPLVRTTTGTSAGGSLAASRPGSALSRRGSLYSGPIEQDLTLELTSSIGR
ncbi:hypothetical protein GPECTOR_69g417 [Gonium pectorale]|uniref:Uncharacterized protein n=1 Tax=Gonium pectorale TaxID=33097 RepID=A0A150G3C5_GONPE|nr:hypothetical protein GPECTOR_69g417 [Gonium pectorale]|eukprot:KXZ44324.1 hypothetical protein GPECTOR_69g417 [Gonium pectorale]